MSPGNRADAPVLLFEHAAASGHVVAEARLNSESTLNALSLPMIEVLAPALAGWAADERVVSVLLTGSGSRAFSAGGDIQALYRAMAANHQAGDVVDDYPFRFFEREYRLDHQLHTYPKPVISVGQGVVMGGGLGVFSAARYRVVTETSRVAMPEVTIGLFPDAGATWLLGHMPPHLAMFLAMTGSHMNGADALAAGVGTHAVAAAERDGVLDSLLTAPWEADPAADDACVQGCLEALGTPELPPSRVVDVPDDLRCDGTVLEAVRRLRSLDGRGEWIAGGIRTMNRGCPTSVGIVVRQLQQAPGLSLAESFRLEMVVATQCARHPDFAEGVRALIIDKDNAPRWCYDSVDDLPEAYVAEHFQAPWPRNPLEDLEEVS